MGTNLKTHEEHPIHHSLCHIVFVKYMTFVPSKLKITHTGWLKIKYPSRQYAISPQPVYLFIYIPHSEKGKKSKIQQGGGIIDQRRAT